MSLLDDIRSEILPIATRVNCQEDRYAAMCCAVVLLLNQIQIGGEDKQQMLGDVSDILDNLPPSPRSGMRAFQRIADGVKVGKFPRPVGHLK
jgi:hypothetical protein